MWPFPYRKLLWRFRHWKTMERGCSRNAPQVSTKRQSAGRGEQMKRLPNSNTFSQQPSGNNTRLILVAGAKEISAAMTADISLWWRIWDSRTSLKCFTRDTHIILPAHILPRQLYLPYATKQKKTLSEKPSLALTTDS